VVIEDGRQAHGALYNGRSGDDGPIGCFQFLGGQVITTGGEGGAVITTDDELDASLRLIRHNARPGGGPAGVFHLVLGYNTPLVRCTQHRSVQLRRLEFSTWRPVAATPPISIRN